MFGCRSGKGAWWRLSGMILWAEGTLLLLVLVSVLYTQFDKVVFWCVRVRGIDIRFPFWVLLTSNQEQRPLVGN